MATVTSFTAARSQEIENSVVTTGFIDLSGHLILTRRDGSTVDAGKATGPAGQDAVLPAELTPTGKVVTDWNTAITNGQYWGKAAINGPAASSWYAGNVMVFVDQSAGTNRIIQELREVSQTNQAFLVRYVRISIDNGVTWTAWMSFSDGRRVTDFNTATQPGKYWGSGAANAPTTVAANTWWLVNVDRGLFTTTYVLQRASIPNHASGRVWSRYSTDDGTTWTAWEQSLPAHVGQALSTGRVYLSTNPFELEATQAATDTYLAMSPQSGTDTGMNNAFWVASNGSNVAHIPKNSLDVNIYDSGWVTSGLTLTPAAGFAINSYRVRRLGDRLTGKIQLTYSGTQLTADTGANFADTSILTMPTGWQENSGMFDGTPLHLERNGVTSFWARAGNSVANTAGVIQLVTGTFAGQLFPAASYELYLDYYLT